MNIKEEAQSLAPYIVEQRRYLHAHPERSFKEKETTAYLKKELDLCRLVTCNKEDIQKGNINDLISIQEYVKK